MQVRATYCISDFIDFLLRPGLPIPDEMDEHALLELEALVADLVSCSDTAMQVWRSQA